MRALARSRLVWYAGFQSMSSRARECLALLVVLSMAVITGGPLTGCGEPPPASYPTSGVASPTPVEAPLGPGDVFELHIYYGSNELKSTHRLNASGKISVPLLRRRRSKFAPATRLLRFVALSTPSMPRDGRLSNRSMA